ncbi:MAG: OmpA family protein [Bacteroidota bacterium]
MELRKSYLLFLLISFVFLTPGFCQQPGKPIGIGISLSYRDFQGIPHGDWPARSFQPIITYSFGATINPSLDVNFAMGLNSMDWVESDQIESLTDIETTLRYHLISSSKIPERKRISPFLIGGIGTLTRGKGPREMNFHLPMGAGVRMYPVNGISIDLQASYKLSEAKDYVAASIGIGWDVGSIRPKDRDGDGIPDNKDDCPLEPGHPAFRGCPDTDGDGISDKLDRCPLLAGNSFFEGCPPPLPDSDLDGVPDPDDLCPNVKGSSKTQGCPDADDDGVRDALDACPEVKGKPSFSGCPDQDNDGVPDDRDDCPQKAGTFVTKGCPDADLDGVRDLDDKCPLEAGPVHLQGCPESLVVPPEETQTQLDSAAQMIQFENGSTILTTESQIQLKEIATLLQENPLMNLRIEGHTDNSGNADRNLRLSHERAEACVSYLVDQGISSSRLSYLGFGEARPIASNDSSDGRAKNRRVEFKLMPN